MTNPLMFKMPDKLTLVYGLYSALWWIASPGLWLMMAWRGRRHQHDWQILSPQRFGRYVQPWDGPQPIWIHAASVGEVRASTPLIQAMVDQGHRVLLTHVTPTGMAQARKIWQSDIDAGCVLQRWVPYDFLRAMQGLIDHYTPKMLILIEREIWPNMIRATRLAGVPIVIASARMSPKSFEQMQTIDRYTFGLMGQTLATVDLVLAQTQEDAHSLSALGAPHVWVAGNLKFDMPLPIPALEAGRAMRATWQRPVIVIASTREGEEALFIEALRSTLNATTPHPLSSPLPTPLPTPLYLVIPRHPQRFDDVFELIRQAGLTCERWSTVKDKHKGLEGETRSWPAEPTCQVWLADTMGEMPFFYALADVAIVCGGFKSWGGQNFIEACVAGAPTLVGPHMYNFAQATQSAVQAGAIVQVDTAQHALALAHQWLIDTPARDAVKHASQTWLSQHAGATETMVNAINDLLYQRAVLGVTVT